MMRSFMITRSSCDPVDTGRSGEAGAQGEKSATSGQCAPVGHRRQGKTGTPGVKSVTEACGDNSNNTKKGPSQGQTKGPFQGQTKGPFQGQLKGPFQGQLKSITLFHTKDKKLRFQDQFQEELGPFQDQIAEHSEIERRNVALSPGVNRSNIGERVNNTSRLKLRPKSRGSISLQKPTVNYDMKDSVRDIKTKMQESELSINTGCIKDSDDEYLLACSKIGDSQWLRGELDGEMNAAYQTEVDNIKERIPPQSPRKLEVLLNADRKETALEQLRIIQELSYNSQLESPYQKVVDESCQELADIIEILSTRTIEEEKNILLADNARLTRELELKRAEMKTLQKALAELNSKERIPPQSPRKSEVLLNADRKETALEQLRIIQELSYNSQLESPYQKVVDESCQELADIIEILSTRTIEEEKNILLADNARLTRELELKRAEMKTLQKALAELNSKERIPPQSPRKAEVLLLNADRKKTALEQLRIIQEVSYNSQLESPYQKVVDESCQELADVIETLSIRTIEEEKTILLADNARLIRELELKRAEMKTLQKALVELNSPSEMTTSQYGTSSLLEGDALKELKTSIISAVGEVLDDKLAYIEKRLWPVTTFEQLPDYTEDAKPEKPKPLPENQPNWWSQEIAELRYLTMRARRQYTRCRRRRHHTADEEECLRTAYKEAKQALKLAINKAKEDAADDQR